MTGPQMAAVRTAMSAGGVSLRPAPPLNLGSEEVLIEVELCGLCGSDLHIWRGDTGYEWVPCGTVLGHEIVGTITEVGTNVPKMKFKQGDRVVPVAQSGCGDCASCHDSYANGCNRRKTLGLSRPGGATRFIQVRFDQLLTVPAGVPSLSAVLTEPLSVAARAAAVRGRVSSSDSVVVSGPGTIGLLTALVCKHLGAEVMLTGTADDRASKSELARKLGLKIVTSLPIGHKPNIWIEASGAEAALDRAVHTLPSLGRLVVVALYSKPPKMSANEAVRKELELVASYSSSPADYRLALQILERQPLLGEHLVQVFPLADVREAMESIGRGAAPKIALSPRPRDAHQEAGDQDQVDTQAWNSRPCLGKQVSRIRFT